MSVGIRKIGFGSLNFRIAPEQFQLDGIKLSGGYKMPLIFAPARLRIADEAERLVLAQPILTRKTANSHEFLFIVGHDRTA